jgi:NADP-dependent 3-hydroxy acid dehydrogenase YdfG
MGKVAVITGASSGVGRAIARAFAEEGARVALIARGRDGLEAAAAEVRALGTDAAVLPLDVSDAAAVDAAADSVAETWGGIDLWVNDAMVSVFSPAAQMQPYEFKRVIEVDYLGYVYGTLAALRHMRRRDAGLIMQIGSALAYRSIPLQSAYCASKAAIRGFTDSLRSELLHEGSRVKLTMLQLPAVNTPQFEVVRSRLPRHPFPVAPVYQPEVIARAAVHAALHPRREVWIGWSATKAIVGERVIPGPLDKYLSTRAWDGQMTEALPPGHPLTHHRDNLDAPLPGDRGAHGPFDAQARTWSTKLWARRHPGLIALGVLALGALLGRVLATAPERR